MAHIPCKLLFGLASTVYAYSAAASGDDAAELAKKALNPVAAMYSLPIQYNWDQKIGPSGDGMHSVTNIQPVLPFTLNEKWNVISRTILPIIDQHGLATGGVADKSGVGDITQSLFFPRRNLPPMVGFSVQARHF